MQGRRRSPPQGKGEDLTTVGIWQPNSDREVEDARHVAGLYLAGTVSVWDRIQLEELIFRYGPLVMLEMDTHARPMSKFWHPSPEGGLYLIGPMNGSIPRELLDSGLGTVVQVETPRQRPLKPSVALAIALHQQYTQQEAYA